MQSNEKEMVNMNRVQMFNSTAADDRPLVHISTGSAKLTKAYAKKTGKTKPNLFASGDFQNKMFMFMPNEKEYFIASKDYKSGYLEKAYSWGQETIFGVSPKNQPKAKEINDKAILDDYKKAVFQ